MPISVKLKGTHFITKDLKTQQQQNYSGDL